MKAVFIEGRSLVEVKDVPVPILSAGDVLVKMEACGICGTDVEKFLGVHSTPPKLGHEVSGIVEKMGSDAVGDLRMGDRVFVHHHVPCYTCHYCRRGDHTMCEMFSRTNLDPCGLAEYFRVPRYNVERGAVLKLPSDVDFDEATFIEPMACCLRGLNKVKVEKGDDVLVIGAGPTGLIITGLLRLFGAGLIISSEVSDHRLEAAGRMGAKILVNPSRENLLDRVYEATDNRGVDLAVVAVGAGKLIEAAADCVRKGGKVLMFGAPPRGELFTYEASKLFIREVSLIPSYSTTEVETNVALRLLESKRLNLKWLISHRFKLSQASEALKVAAEGREALKVIVNP
ncbi:MAG: alcohol dehydrogenase catalytic domain-containing protein [Candidatus Brockarchaeota archaeon]|nr:alcohol dehydrogenase catalytic domain-containing protein [Candidatus Brockarchaeota archaeon]